MVSSVKRFGSIEDILNLSMPSTSLRAFIKSKKVCSLTPFLKPKSPMFTPVKTISLTPLFAISLAAFTTFSIVSERLAPRASGIVQ